MNRFLVLVLLLVVFVQLPLLAAKSWDVKVFLGYADQPDSPYTVDLFLAQELVNRLTSPCSNPPDESMACGFSWLEGDFHSGIILERSHRGTQLRLWLAASSYTSYDPNNRGRFIERQVELSKVRYAQFLQSLKQADVVVYAGHSRYGKGPDFFPKIKDSPVSRGSVMDEVFLAMQTSEKMNHLALLSCDSAKHWYSSLKKIFINDQTMQSRVTLYPKTLLPSEVPQQLIQVLNRVVFSKRVTE